MKHLKTISLIILCNISSITLLKSQCINTYVPTTQDLVALPSTGCISSNAITSTENTGYDVWYDAPNSRHMQVIVWDRLNASFSWDYGGAQGSFLFTNTTPFPGLNGTSLHDPDVVVNDFNGDIYAMVVGETDASLGGGNGDRIYWVSLIWTGTTFNYVVDGFLGDMTVADDVCRNPNIDVNYCDDVSGGETHLAITWHQDRTVTVDLESTSGTYNVFNFTSSTINILRSDIYSALGRIDGTGCGGTGPVAGIGNANGDLISDPPTITRLFERNRYPDVSYGEPGTFNACNQSFITYTWVQEWFDPEFFIICKRVVSRTYEGGCSGFGGQTMKIWNMEDLSCSYDLLRPRIAARPGNGSGNPNPRDFQIVMGIPRFYCDCNNGCRYDTRILNWGVHGDNVIYPTSGSAGDPFILNMTTSGPCDLNTYYNHEAVVTYLPNGSAFGTAGNYVVAWTHGPDFAGNTGLSAGAARDVIACTFNQGVLIGAANDFSIVNDDCNGTGQVNNQHIPSVAGRYARSTVGYCFWNEWAVNKEYIGYKLGVMTVQPGTGSLRQGQFNDDVATLFEAIPNPFKDQIVFKFLLGAKEIPLYIEILDSKGSRVVKIMLQPENKELLWESKDILKEGIYIAKLISNENEYNIKISQLK